MLIAFWNALIHLFSLLSPVLWKSSRRSATNRFFKVINFWSLKEIQTNFSYNSSKIIFFISRQNDKKV